MAKRITYPEFVSLFAKQNGKDKQSIDKFLSTLFDIIVDQLEVDKIVKVRHIGTFKLDWVAPRRITNVNTGEDSVVGGNYKISFTPAKELAESVNSAYAHMKPIELDEIEENEKIVKADEMDVKEEIEEADEFLLAEEKVKSTLELLSEDSNLNFTLKKEIIAELNDARNILSQIKGLGTKGVEEESDALTEQDEPVVQIEEITIKEITPESLVNSEMQDEISKAEAFEQAPQYYERLDRLSEIVSEINEEPHTPEEPIVESETSLEKKMPIAELAALDAELTLSAIEPVEPIAVVAETDKTEPAIQEVLPDEQPIIEKPISSPPIAVAPIAVATAHEESSPSIKTLNPRVMNPETPQTTKNTTHSETPTSQNMTEESTPEKKNNVSRLSVVVVLAIVVTCFAYIYFAYFNKGYSKDSAANTQEVTISLPSSISKALNSVVNFFSNLFVDEQELETKDMKITREEDAPIESIEESASSEDSSAVVSASSSTENKSAMGVVSHSRHIDEVMVTFGQSLISLSRQYYGAKEFWCYIYLENQKAIGSPNNLKSGTRLLIPSKESYNIDANNPASVELAKQKCSEILRSAK